MPLRERPELLCSQVKLWSPGARHFSEASDSGEGGQGDTSKPDTTVSGGRGGHLFGTIDYKFKGENVYFCI